MMGLRMVGYVATWTIVGVLGGGAMANAQSPVPQPSPSPLPGLTEEEQEEAIFGKASDPDYVAKNFALVAGGVILNQFVVNSDDETLSSGSTDAQAFVEANYRHRWAWMARDPFLKPAGESPSAAKFNLAVSEAEVELAKLQKASADPGSVELARRALEDSRAKLWATGASEREALHQYQDAERVARETLARTQLEEPSALKEARVALKKAKAQKSADGTRTAEANLKSVSSAPAVRRYLQAEKRDKDALEKIRIGAPRVVKQARSREKKLKEWRKLKGRSRLATRSDFTDSWTGFLLPDDWSARLGYAFGGKTGTSAQQIVGASDLYAHVGAAWNAVRWSLPTEKPTDVPIRGAVSLEVATLWFTDKEVQDVHTRVLIGPSVSFGIPFSFQSDDEKAAKGPPAIAELVAKIGAAYAEAPVFAGDPDQPRKIKYENGFPRYGNRWGVGFDVEFNVPVSKKLGYLMLRGSMTADLDPNPWVISLGYTIPLSTIWSGIAG